MKRGKGLSRRAPLKARKGPKRTSGRPKGSSQAQRAASRRSGRFKRSYYSPEFVRFTKHCCCVACGKKASPMGPSECSHHPSRGAGGTYRDVSPLCTECHRDFHSWGQATFQRRHDLDLKAENRRHWKAFKRWGEVWP